MILVHDVSMMTEAIESRLKTDPLLMEYNTVIERSVDVNQSSSLTPWIGIYRIGQTFPARTLGAGSGYRRQQPTFALVLQEAHPTDPKLCEVLLERLVARTLSVLFSDESLGGQVDVLDEINVQYYDYTRDDNDGYHQTAAIVFTGITNVARSES